MSLARRDLLTMSLGGLALFAAAATSRAQGRQPFAEWVEAFRARARAKGVSDETYTRVMSGLTPDTSVYEQDRNQPEFREELWKYLNRRVSEWRIKLGRERAQTYAGLLDRIERDYGVDKYVILGLWGVETAFGEIVANPKYVRPVIPALAALAWGEPRRRAAWEQELINALIIIQRGWSNPAEMVGSWAGAMGHTQWMPEVWLHVGIDYDGDGKISPFGKPDDALGSSARFLQQRGKYRRGEVWGCEVELPAKLHAPAADNAGPMRKVSAWTAEGVKTADGRPMPGADALARLWQPVAGGPAFLLMANFFAVRTYNPAGPYALSLLHLADRIRGEKPFVKPFPGGERILTIAEIQEIQHRLVALGYETEYTDGRVSRDMLDSVRAYQRKVGIAPADGYPGLQVLARLRQGA